MSLIKRVCPLCAADSYNTVVILKESQFTKSNPSYRLDRISELGLDPEQHYPVVSCRECGMIYSLYQLDSQKEAIVYNRIIDTEISKNKVLAEGRKRSDLKRWENLSALLNKQGYNNLGIKLLDYGCGWGTLLLTAKGPDVKAVGFEVTGAKAEWARWKGLTICSSEDELFKNAPFDICICTSVLEHMGDPVETVRKLTFLLKPDGFAHITAAIGGITPLLFWKDIRRRIKKNLAIPKEVNPWEHLNYFTHHSLVKILKNFGFIPLPARGRRYLISKFPNIWSSGYWQLKGS